MCLERESPTTIPIIAHNQQSSPLQLYIAILFESGGSLHSRAVTIIIIILAVLLFSDVVIVLQPSTHHTSMLHNQLHYQRQHTQHH